MRRSWKIYAVAVPLAIVVALAAVFVWGQFQPKPPGFAPTVAEAVTVEPETATVQFTVDARDKLEWVFFDFDSGAVVDSDFTALDWDFAFRRTKLRTNSGETNALGPVGVAGLGEVDLALIEPPAAPQYAVDALIGEDGDELKNPAIEKWYFYNFVRHVIVARADVYLVRTGGARDAMVRFDSYYCEDQSPGCVTFTYRLVPGASTAGRPR